MATKVFNSLDNETKQAMRFSLTDKAVKSAIDPETGIFNLGKFNQGLKEAVGNNAKVMGPEMKQIALGINKLHQVLASAAAKDPGFVHKTTAVALKAILSDKTMQDALFVIAKLPVNSPKVKAFVNGLQETTKAAQLGTAAALTGN